MVQLHISITVAATGSPTVDTHAIQDALTLLGVSQLSNDLTPATFVREVVLSGHFEINRQLLLVGASGFRIRGLGAGATKLSWVGSYDSDGGLLLLRNCRDGLLEDIVFEAREVALRCGAAVICETANFAGTELATDPRFRGEPPTNLHFNRLKIVGSDRLSRTFDYGLRFRRCMVWNSTPTWAHHAKLYDGGSAWDGELVAPTYIAPDHNNSEHRLTQVSVFFCRKVGISFEHSQSKAHRLYGCSIIFCAVGVSNSLGVSPGHAPDPEYPNESSDLRLVPNSSGAQFFFHDGNMGGNGVADFVLGNGEPITIDGVTSEASRRFLLTTHGTSVKGVGGYLEDLWVEPTGHTEASPVTIRGVHWQAGIFTEGDPYKQIDCAIDEWFSSGSVNAAPTADTSIDEPAVDFRYHGPLTIHGSKFKRFHYKRVEAKKGSNDQYVFEFDRTPTVRFTPPNGAAAHSSALTVTECVFSTPNNLNLNAEFPLVLNDEPGRGYIRFEGCLVHFEEATPGLAVIPSIIHK